MTSETALSRRRFLAGAGVACTAGFLAPTFRPELALAADGAADHTLVVVLLDGGLDGISALVPAADPAYARHRRQTLVPGERAIPVDRGFALHPALAPVAELWRSGLVAAIPATGTPGSTRSHFVDAAAVAAGFGADANGDGTGWLARHLLTRSGGVTITLQGVSSGGVPASELDGHGGAFFVPNLAATGVRGWDPARSPAVEAALSDSYAAAGPVLRGPGAVAFDALRRLRSSGAAQIASRADYAGDSWGAQLRQVAQLVRADVGVEAAVVRFHGWDTHRGQGGVDGHLGALLGQLARAVASFAADLHDRLDRVTIVVVSEFGRRVAENGSGGTDHGRGGLVLVVGRGIRGGVHGPWPGLADDALVDGDVAVTTDVRSVLAEVVRGRLGNPAVDQVFPGFAPAPIGFA